MVDILPQFVAHQSSPCVLSAAKVSSWIDIKATCDNVFSLTAFFAHIEVHTSTDSHSNESTLMRVAVPRGSTSTRGRQSRRVMRQRVVVKANTTCVDLWPFEHFSCERSKENSVTSWNSWTVADCDTVWSVSQTVAACVSSVRWAVVCSSPPHVGVTGGRSVALV